MDKSNITKPIVINFDAEDHKKLNYLVDQLKITKEEIIIIIIHKQLQYETIVELDLFAELLWIKMKNKDYRAN